MADTFTTCEFEGCPDSLQKGTQSSSLNHHGTVCYILKINSLLINLPQMFRVQREEQ